MIFLGLLINFGMFFDRCILKIDWNIDYKEKICENVCGYYWGESY